jgi:hypothetical protein
MDRTEIISKLQSLLEKSISFNALVQEEREEFRNRLLSLPDEKLLNVIGIYERELLEAEKIDREQQDKMPGLLANLHQATQQFKKASINSNERTDKKEAEIMSKKLLDKLKKI